MLPFKLTPEFVWVKTPFNEKDKVRNVLNGVWSKKEGMYKFPRNIHAMRELIKMFPMLKASADYIEAGQRMVAARNTALGLKTREDVDGDPRLRPYQRVDVNYLKKLPAALIANEPRTGKTPTSIILMEELNMSYDMKKFLVVAPASLAINWSKEFETWYPNCKVYLVKGTPKKREKLYTDYKDDTTTRVLIISKDTWKSDQYAFTKFVFDAVFVDEAHYLRNYDTAQSTAIMGIQASRRYALTGTPTIKHTADIYGILKFLYPARFSSYWQFVERYFNQSEDRWGHRQIGDVKKHRQVELQEMIGFMGVQRKRQDVMPWLPPKQYIPLYCEMDKKQARLYQQMLEDFVAYIEDAELEDTPVVDTANVLAQLMRLRQLCLDPQLLGFDVPSAKTTALVEWLDNNREPVVIMSMFTSYFDILKPQIEKLGLKVGMIHGKMSSTEKEQSKVDFQNGKTDVLLCNIISAGVGFTLDKAKVIIFTDKAWNPAENEQAEDRITPTTQAVTHDHTVLSLVIPGTIDERIHAILTQKKNLTDVVNEGGRNAIRQLLT